jgi:succinate dehydrogenase/fumarate reductase flavoprotein subunit
MQPANIAMGSPIRTDVLVIGGGLAGHRAAIAARKAGAEVAMVYPSRGASPFIIGCNAPLGHENREDSPQAYFDDMVQGGYGLNDRRLVQVLAHGAAADVHELADIGVPFAGTPDKFSQRHLSGNRYARSVYHPDGFGAEAVAHLSTYARSIGVIALSGRKAVQLLRDRDEVCGALTLRRHTGELAPVLAEAVVLACGGLGRIFADSTYPADISADSYALAFESGATLIDMEFVQFEPTVACYPPALRGLEMPTAMLGDGAQLIGAGGSRFMLRYNPEFAETRMEKARLSLCIQKEIDEGRGFPEGGVLFDTTQVPAGKLESYVAHCRRMRAAGVEPTRQGPQVRPAAHSQMGGVQIDQNGWAGVPGLYAGGEAAGGVHGASRLAGNGGSDAMVFGAVAGRGAAASLSPRQAPRDWTRIAGQALTALQSQHFSEKGPTADAVKEEIRQVMSKSAGLYRSATGLAQGLQALSGLGSVIEEGLCLAGTADLAAALEARNMVLAGKCVVLSALARKESRGSHQRLDHPQSDDAHFLVHLGVRRTANGEPGISTIPIA